MAGVGLERDRHTSRQRWNKETGAERTSLSCDNSSSPDLEHLGTEREFREFSNTEEVGEKQVCVVIQVTVSGF